MLHKDMLPGDGHILHNWVVATATDRLSLSVASPDEGKVAYQTDVKAFYILLTASPTKWEPLTRGIAEVAATAAAARKQRDKMVVNRAANHIYMFKHF